MAQHPQSLAIAALLFALLAGIKSPSVLAAESCGDYGTSVNFADSPAEAARRALAEEKLVFVLHVSGDFELPEFT